MVVENSDRGTLTLILHGPKKVALRLKSCVRKNSPAGLLYRASMEAVAPAALMAWKASTAMMTSKIRRRSWGTMEEAIQRMRWLLLNTSSQYRMLSRSRGGSSVSGVNGCRLMVQWTTFDLYTCLLISTKDFENFLRYLMQSPAAAGADVSTWRRISTSTFPADIFFVCGSSCSEPTLAGSARLLRGFSDMWTFSNVAAAWSASDFTDDFPNFPNLCFAQLLNPISRQPAITSWTVRSCPSTVCTDYTLILSSSTRLADVAKSAGDSLLAHIVTCRESTARYTPLQALTRAPLFSCGVRCLTTSSGGHR
mmetsp:Transcript_27792/g.60773  ORF Transcript_27792/g.60773 Transcript_27792/m.60773 type:complete len:309 (-) Transcript_27792:342-1268(-)